MLYQHGHWFASMEIGSAYSVLLLLLLLSINSAVTGTPPMEVFLGIGSHSFLTVVIFTRDSAIYTVY